MSVDKNEKKDESPYNISSNHINREERYRSNSPMNGPVKNEYQNLRDKSPERETENKELTPNRENQQHFIMKDQQYLQHSSERPERGERSERERPDRERLGPERERERPERVDRERLGPDRPERLDRERLGPDRERSERERLGPERIDRPDRLGPPPDRHFSNHSNYNLPPHGGPDQYRMPPNPPMNPPNMMHNRQYPQKDFPPRRYNEFTKDFMVSKKKEDLNLTDAMQFLESVKTVFSSDLSVYDSFLEVMRDYKHGKLDAAGVVRAATSLFKSKPELLDGFNDFLPGEFKVDRNYRRRIRMDGPMRPPHERFPDQLPPRPERLGERMGERMGERFPERINERIPERINDRSVLDRPIMDRPMDRVMERPIPKDHLPIHDQKMGSELDWENPQTNEQLQALNFIKKAKIQLKSSGTYKQFIDLLTNFQKTKDGYVMPKMHKILADFPDLIEEFMTFVPKKENSVINKIKEILEEKGVHEEFLRSMNLFNQKLMKGQDLVFFLRAYVKDEKMIELFKKHLGDENPDVYLKEKEENTKRETEKRQQGFLYSLGSYRICADKLPKANQDPIAKQVLNNVCYSFPLYASEGGDDVQTRKSAYMDTLYRLEDERYDLELLIQRTESLAESFEIYISRNSEPKEEESSSEEELDLSVFEMPAPLINEIIISIYGDEGEDIFDELITKPRLSIPVILKRLYKLMKSWKLELREKEKVWRETTERAFYKSLDYHLDFKSGDKKYLNYKYFVKHLECDMDISQIYDSREDAVRLIRARYPDENVDDLFEIGLRTLPVEIAARIKYFYLLVSRISEIKSNLQYDIIMEMIEGQISTPMADFEERLRSLSKSQAYKLVTVERLVDKIVKNEQGNGEQYEVTLGDKLLIKSLFKSTESESKETSEEIDYSMIHNLPYLKSNIDKDKDTVFSYKIVPQLKNNNQKIRYNEDEVDYIFKKQFKRHMGEDL